MIKNIILLISLIALYSIASESFSWKNKEKIEHKNN